MIVTLQTQGLQSLEQVRAFLEGSQSLGFEIPNREATYEFIARTLRHFAYTRLGKADKGLLKRYLSKVTGRSRAQITRLIAQFRKTGRIPPLRALAMALQILASLEEAHRQGMVHRDLKPENIMLLERSGTPDFVKVQPRTDTGGTG